MKRRISLLMVLVLILTMMVGTTASASTRLTTREKAIAKAYIKTIDEQNAKYINKYKHRSVDKFVVADLNGKSAKFFDTELKKKYDKSEKMNYVEVSGILIIYDEDGNLIIADATTGIFIKKSGGKMFAYGENKNVVDSEIISPDDLDDDVYSDIEEFLLDEFDEDTVESMFEIAAEYADANGDVSEDDSDYEDDGDTSKDDVKIPTKDTTADSKGVIAIGNTYTWSGVNNYLGCKTNGNYALTIINSKDITASDAIKMDPYATSSYYKSEYDYKLLTVKWEISDVINNGDNEIYQSMILPNLYGSVTKETKQENFIISYAGGFKESLGTIMDTQLKYSKLASGDSTSFSAEGKVIVAVAKNKISYLKLKTETGDVLFSLEQAR